MQKLRLAAALACAIPLGGCGTTPAQSPKPSATSAVVPFRPTELAFDPAGVLYASDCFGGHVFKVGRSGELTVVAGTGGAHDGGLVGEGGPATAAQVECPYGLTFNRNGELVIADHANNRIRQVGLDGIIKTIVGTGPVGSRAGSFGGDGGPAAQANLRAPVSVLFDREGNLYIGDRDNSTIRKVGPQGTITTIAGIGTRGYVGDSGPATRAQLDQPEGMAFDGAGNLYVVDSANNRIRKIDTHGIITTLAGTGTAGYTGDGGPALQAQMQPDDLVFDPAGNLYIAEFGNHVVRKIDTKGIIRTIAGTGKEGCSGYGGRATGALLMSPLSPVLDSTGNLYFADGKCHAVLRIDPSGILSIYAGSPR